MIKEILIGQFFDLKNNTTPSPNHSVDNMCGNTNSLYMLGFSDSKMAVQWEFLVSNK